MKKPFIMDKDVYDAIDLASEASGGLRAGRLYDDGDTCGCMAGAAHFAGVFEGDRYDLYPAILKAVEAGTIPHYAWFDNAHDRLTRDASQRLPWPVVAQEANIVRGS